MVSPRFKSCVPWAGIQPDSLIGLYGPGGLQACHSRSDITFAGRVYPIYQYAPMCSRRVHDRSQSPQTLHPYLHSV